MFSIEDCMKTGSLLEFEWLFSDRVLRNREWFVGYSFLGLVVRIFASFIR
jgi:hypothetical protein